MDFTRDREPFQMWVNLKSERGSGGEYFNVQAKTKCRSGSTRIKSQSRGLSNRKDDAGNPVRN